VVLNRVFWSGIVIAAAVLPCWPTSKSTPSTKAVEGEKSYIGSKRLARDKNGASLRVDNLYRAATRAYLSRD
jgi:hypothetical protein